MEESGVLQRVRNKWIGQYDEAFSIPTEIQALQAIELGFENVIFPFLILSTGICSGGILLAYEKLVRRERRQEMLFDKAFI